MTLDVHASLPLLRSVFDRNLKVLETSADGVDEAELKDAVDGLLKAREQSRAEDANLAGQLRSNAWLDRSMQWQAGLDEALRGLTVDDVNAALRRQLGEAGFSVFAAGDFARLEAKAD